MRYEYTGLEIVAQNFNNTEEMIAELNKYGAEGWQVVNINAIPNIGLYVIMQREIARGLGL